MFAAGDRTIRQAMFPRATIDFLVAGTTVEQARRAVWEHTHTRYPVHDGDPSRVSGSLHVRDLFAPSLAPEAPIRELVRPIAAHPPDKKLHAVLGRTPRPGDVVEVAGHRLTVASVEGWRVGQVTVEPLAGPAGGR